jgi:hypothetical protein
VKKKANIKWQVRGGKWTRGVFAPESSDAVELATKVIEQVWGGGEEEAPDEELGVGLFLEVSHDKMKSPDEHILVPVGLALANAGWHGECARVEKIVEKMDLPYLLACLVSEIGLETLKDEEGRDD